MTVKKETKDPKKDDKDVEDKSVPYERFKEVNEAKNALSQEIEDLKTKLAELEKNSGDKSDESDKDSKDEDRETVEKLTNDIESMRAELMARDKKDFVRKHLDNLGVTKQDRILRLVDLEGIKISDGKVEGADAVVEAVKTDYPELFEVESKKTANGIGSGSGDNPDDGSDDSAGDLIKEQYNLK